MKNIEILGEWGFGEYDSSLDDAHEGAWQEKNHLQVQGWSELTITEEWDTAQSGTVRLRGVKRCRQEGKKNDGE